jgi:proteasome lid subunit RPN8/RPN11
MKERILITGLDTPEKKKEAEEALKLLGYKSEETWNSEYRQKDCCEYLLLKKGQYAYHSHDCEPSTPITLEQLKQEAMKEKVDNVVIKAVKKGDGARIIEYFKSLGVNTKGFTGACYEEDRDLFIYYGVIDGKFNNYALCDVEKSGAKIETLPKQGVWWTREQFMKLHSVACGSWRSKLVGMFPQFAVEDTCEIKESEYKSMRDACTSHQREVLDSIFGEEPFKKKVYFMCTKNLRSKFTKKEKFTKGEKYELLSFDDDGYKFVDNEKIAHTVFAGSWADYFYRID